MKPWIARLIVCGFVLFQVGCSALEEHVLFMTKTNVGIDVDSKPPTAEISIARREAVLEPTFEGGQTPQSWRVFGRLGAA